MPVIYKMSLIYSVTDWKIFKSITFITILIAND